MGKITYQECVVLRVIRWRDDRFILNLLGKDWCVFTASWSLPKSKKVKKPLHPELFQNIQATLQKHHDGMIRLRDYRETKSPDPTSLSNYLGLNTLSRYFLIACSEGPDRGPWHIWQKHQYLDLMQPIHRLSLHAELAYHSGVWPDGHYCETCNSTIESQVFIDQAALLCKNCQDGGQMIHVDSIKWIQNFFYKSNSPNPHELEIESLSLWLKRRLPEQTQKDKTMRKLWSIYKKRLSSSIPRTLHA